MTDGAFGYEGGEEFNDEQLLSMFMDVEGLNSLHGTAVPGQHNQQAFMQGSATGIGGGHHRLSASPLSKGARGSLRKVQFPLDPEEKLRVLDGIRQLLAVVR